MGNILKEEVKKLLVSLPEWVDTTKSSHHDLWTFMVEINSNIFYLTKDRVIKKDEYIRETFDFIISLIDVIYDTIDIDDDIDLLLILHYYKILITIKDISISLEEYEVTNNINRLLLFLIEELEGSNEEDII